MGIVEAIGLGIVQGLTEFLPVSSTGHLVLAEQVLGVSGEYGLAFDAVLHLATAGAVIFYFFSDIMMLVNTALRKLSRLPVNKQDLTLLYAVLVGTIPAVVFGLLLESLMETWFRSALLVAGVLVIGSVFFMYAEWQYLNQQRQEDIDIQKGLKIGFFQVLALIPGFSRSGATISGGMLLGLTRHEAARFAFLLSVPVILGAGCKKLLELITSDGVVDWMPVIVGSAAAFTTGVLAIHFMLGFVRKHTLWPFIWYRIILAAFVIFVVIFG